MNDTHRIHHPGPPLGVLALVFAVIFLAGTYTLTMFGKGPHFPPPWQTLDTIAAFFRARPGAVLVGAALYFGAAIPLGLFTATIVSRLRFLGVSAAGAHIALFGGFGAAFALLGSSCVLWALAKPGSAPDQGAILALYWMHQALGGPGFTVCLGLLMAGVSVPAHFYRLLPEWIAALGIGLGICGVLTWLRLFSTIVTFLLPITSFGGLLWLIAAAFALPSTIEAPAASRARRGVPRVA